MENPSKLVRTSSGVGSSLPGPGNSSPQADSDIFLKVASSTEIANNIPSNELEFELCEVNKIANATAEHLSI